MSVAATTRYNGPNWKPKQKKPKHIGQRRSIYESKVTPLQKKIKHNTRCLLRQKLINRNLSKSDNTFALLGYSSDDLIKHLESKFRDGMTWDNYGKDGWHIDHVIPDSWFSYSSTEDEQFKLSWSLQNLQPLWAIDNCSKGNRYSGEIINA